MNLLFPLIITLFISACTILDVADSYNNLTFSPLDFDPVAIEFVFAVPENVDLNDGDAKALLMFEPEQAGGFKAVKIDADLNIAELDENTELKAEFESKFFTATFSYAAAKEFRFYQEAIRNLKKEETEGVGTFAVRINGACHHGDVPEPFLFSVWFRNIETDEYRQLVDAVDLWDYSEKFSINGLNERVHECMPPARIGLRSSVSENAFKLDKTNSANRLRLADA